MPDLLVDLLKHITTLNVAALVLFLALLKDFPSAGGSSGLPTWTVGLFGFSLIVAALGLLGAVLHKENFPSQAFAGCVLSPFLLAIVTFIAAMLLAVLSGLKPL